MDRQKMDTAFGVLFFLAIVFMAGALAGRFNILHMDDTWQISLLAAGLALTAIGNGAASYGRRGHTK